MLDRGFKDRIAQKHLVLIVARLRLTHADYHNAMTNGGIGLLSHSIHPAHSGFGKPCGTPYGT